ncbi:MAG: hypothetical protein RQM92_07080 [Candidatus Syntrophopropionicum ammoniitolerans]
MSWELGPGGGQETGTSGQDNRIEPCTVPFAEMSHYLEEADVIFNTIPALVLTGKVLDRIPAGTLILDLASAPGSRLPEGGKYWY